VLGEAEACDELICVNDSVYGPLADLGSTLGNSRLANVDFGGMCLSTQDPLGGTQPQRAPLAAAA
jgi:hypothetical protein